MNSLKLLIKYRLSLEKMHTFNKNYEHIVHTSHKLLSEVDTGLQAGAEI